MSTIWLEQMIYAKLALSTLPCLCAYTEAAHGILAGAISFLEASSPTGWNEATQLISPSFSAALLSFFLSQPCSQCELALLSTVHSDAQIIVFK